MAQEMTKTAKQDVQSRGEVEETRSAVIFRPNADIYEAEDKVVLVADMPGVAPDDVDVTLERGVLSIRGHVRPQAHDGYRQIYTEYGEGDFERVFTLSEDIDRDRIKANHKDGVLTLELPKSAAAKAKKIQVDAK